MENLAKKKKKKDISSKYILTEKTSQQKLKIGYKKKLASLNLIFEQKDKIGRSVENYSNFKNVIKS